MPSNYLIVVNIIFIKKLYLKAFKDTMYQNVEKKQLIVFFLQITVDNGYLSDYYGCIVIQEEQQKAAKEDLSN